jgi:hypothetical protein
MKWRRQAKFEEADCDFMIVMITARSSGHDHMPVFRALIGTLGGAAQAC